MLPFQANDSAENVVSSEGLVIGAILADAADGIDASGESSGNAAVLVTGFTGTAEVWDCRSGSLVDLVYPVFGGTCCIIRPVEHIYMCLAHCQIHLVV